MKIEDIIEIATDEQITEYFTRVCAFKKMNAADTQKIVTSALTHKKRDFFIWHDGIIKTVDTDGDFSKVGMNSSRDAVRHRYIHERHAKYVAAGVSPSSEYIETEYVSSKVKPFASRLTYQKISSIIT